MAKILVLAQTGFGKTTSLGNIPELNIEGLNPKETFIISATSKPLPFRGSAKMYKVCDVNKAPTADNGNRYITNQGEDVAKVIDFIVRNRSEIVNIVIDDSNYVMQDYYMANAKKKGYDVFKDIGVHMDQIFSAMEAAPHINFVMMAHFEEYRDSSADTISYRFKTVGKMVRNLCHYLSNCWNTLKLA